MNPDPADELAAGTETGWWNDDDTPLAQRLPPDLEARDPPRQRRTRTTTLLDPDRRITRLHHVLGLDRLQVWRESWAAVREGTMGLFGKRETAVGWRATIRRMTARKQ